MSKKYLPILQLTDTGSDFRSFVNFWSTLYSYPQQDRYNQAISKNQFKTEDIHNLFIWKNGMELSTLKNKSLETKILSKLQLINLLKRTNDWGISDFNEHFSDLKTFVWKIFLLHIIQPSKYPIYDQHIHRAYNFINGVEYKNVSANTLSEKQKEDFYFNTYLKFIEGLEMNIKTVDEALFAFGRFIKTNEFARLVTKS
jgi:hypothetical protein